MKVAGETWQRSRRTSPAAGSYIQPWKLHLFRESCHKIIDRERAKVNEKKEETKFNNSLFLHCVNYTKSSLVPKYSFFYYGRVSQPHILKA